MIQMTFEVASEKNIARKGDKLHYVEMVVGNIARHSDIK